MVVNENAGFLDERGVLWTIASKLAPTGTAITINFRNVS